MADMIIQYRVMPEGGEVDFSELETAVKDCVSGFDSSVTIKTTSSAEIGFGLKAVIISFQIDEKFGSEELENKLKDIELVGDVTVELMDRL